MSIATQIERLQGVRDQIRTKMVGLGLSENTDLLQNLADDLDGVDKISPTNNGTTDPGTGYTNVDTLDRSTSTRYIKVPKGYNDADRKFTVSGVANGAYSASVSSHTTSNATASSSVTGSITAIASTTKPSGNDSADYFTITPKLITASGSSKATGKATIGTAGYLATGNTTSSESSKSVGVTATQGGDYYLKSSSVSVGDPGVDPGTNYSNKATVNPTAEGDQYVKITAGYLSNSKITFKKMPEGSYSASVASHTTSNATASSNVSGSIVNIASATKPSTGNDGSDYFTITPELTTAAGSSKATGKATVDTAGYLLAGNKTSSESSKSVGVTASQGSSYYLKAGSYSASVASHEVTNATAGSSVAGSITNITSTTKPSAGTDGTNYYTITPKLTTGNGSSKATGKATISANGFLGVGNKTSSESSKSVGVTATQGDSYYLPAGSYSASVSSHTTSNATASSSVTGSVTNIATTTAPTSGTDGTDYYTITPKLTTEAGSSKATGKATVGTAGYLVTGSTTSGESSKSVGVTATQGDNYYLKASSVTKEDPGTGYTNKVTVTPSTSAQYVKVTAGYLPNSKITVEAIPSPYFDTSKVTATAGTVLKDYKFVDSSGATVTGTIATADSSNVSGSVSGSDPSKITLTTEKTLGSSSTTATASATVAKGLYTGSSNIEKSLTSKTLTATAEATLATSVTGTDKIPTTLPSGTVTITPSTDNVKRIYSDSKNKGFMTGVVLEAMPTGAYSASVASHTTTNASASSSVTGSITNIVTSTKPSTGTDGTDYYTITPKLTTGSGSSKAIGRAAVDTAGYLVTGNTTSEESSVDVGVTASQGDSYYLKASSVTKEDPGTSYVNKATVTPSTGAQYVKVTAGYLPNSKITVEAIPNQKGKDDVTATVTADVSNITSIDASQVTDGVTVTASASGSTVVPVGYYSTQVSKTPSSSKSTTIKPKLAGTNGSIELTAGTSAFTKTSTADYSNGFITSVKVNPTPSETKEFTPTIDGDTVEPTPGSLLSSVTVWGVPRFRVTLSSSIWKSDSNVTVGKYYYNVSGDIITASNNLYVVPEDASTSQSFGVYAYSQSKESGASTGTLQFRAMIQPTSDLGYIVYYLS